MIRLDSYQPSQHEIEVLQRFPDQVAIGYLRAWRHANGNKRDDGRPVMDWAKAQQGVEDLFNLFGERNA